MDALRRELEKKRRALDAQASLPKKYVKHSELELALPKSPAPLKNAVSEKEGSKEESAVGEKKPNPSNDGHNSSEQSIRAKDNLPGPSTANAAISEEVPGSAEAMSSEERSEYNATRRPLSSQGQPSTSPTNGISKNDMKQDMRQTLGAELVTPKLIKKDKQALAMNVVAALKLALWEWEQHLERREEAEKLSPAGMKASALFQESRSNLRPLFRSLKKGTLNSDVLLGIAHIVHHMQLREYMRANDAYLQLSIGNAPWPIGVISVHIHERSSDSKLDSSNIAHVLNNDVSRKYIQSVKRILTVMQNLFPPDDATQKMG